MDRMDKEMIARIAGAIYDFGGFITTQKDSFMVGGDQDAAPMAALTASFLDLRGLAGVGPLVEDWEWGTPILPPKGTCMLKVAGTAVAWTVSSPAIWSNNGMGRCDTIKGEVLTSDALPPSQTAQILMHEIVHYVLDVFGYTKEADDEVLVSILSVALTAFIQDNPQTVSFIQKAMDMSHATK
jgi:hypothetical protein